MLFEEQLSRKPNLYPWTQDFINAMWSGHWTPNEFNFQSDVHDYKINLSDEEREIVKSTLSAIGQIEVAEKLGRTQSYLSKIESGQRRFDVLQLKEFAKIYKKPLDYFVK